MADRCGSRRRRLFRRCGQTVTEYALCLLIGYLMGIFVNSFCTRNLERNGWWGSTLGQLYPRRSAMEVYYHNVESAIAAPGP